MSKDRVLERASVDEEVEIGAQQRVGYAPIGSVADGVGVDQASSFWRGAEIWNWDGDITACYIGHNDAAYYHDYWSAFFSTLGQEHRRVFSEWSQSSVVACGNVDDRDEF